MRMRLGELAEKLGVTFQGDGSIEITGVAGIREAEPGQLTFLGHPKYEVFLGSTRASAIIMATVPPGGTVPVLVSPQPYLTFLQALKIFAEDRLGIQLGIHPTAVVAPGAVLGPNISIGPHVTIGDQTTLGEGVVIMAGSFIGGEVTIGNGTFVYPNAVIREGTKIGERVIVHSGAIIGDDGFGFARDGGVIRKIPQIGNVEIGDDVEVGANTTIDRATTGTTRIGRGTRIDNLVMIAHNVEIGENSILCAQVGISGSAKVGDDVTLAGQVGLAGHIEVGDRVRVGAQAGVTKSVPEDLEVSGYPALPHGLARRVYASMRHLPEMLRQIRDLARRIEALEARKSEEGDRG